MITTVCVYICYSSLNFGASSNDFMIGVLMKKFGWTHLKKSTIVSLLFEASVKKISIYSIIPKCCIYRFVDLRSVYWGK